MKINSIAKLMASQYCRIVAVSSSEEFFNCIYFRMCTFGCKICFWYGLGNKIVDKKSDAIDG